MSEGTLVAAGREKNYGELIKLGDYVLELSQLISNQIEAKLSGVTKPSTPNVSGKPEEQGTWPVQLQQIKDRFKGIEANMKLVQDTLDRLEI